MEDKRQTGPVLARLDTIESKKREPESSNKLPSSQVSVDSTSNDRTVRAAVFGKQKQSERKITTNVYSHVPNQNLANSNPLAPLTAKGAPKHGDTKSKTSGLDENYGLNRTQTQKESGATLPATAHKRQSLKVGLTNSRVLNKK